MTIAVNFNDVVLNCEYNDTFVRTARTIHGDDILPILSASTGIHGELIRLVREAHKREYKDEL